MIDLTVKTLDSQNHAFSLADDITIREFKEHIAETVNVSADSQRLIYCGRVLQDEKHLSEYDVNGKVIHLVERAPPQSTQQGNSSGSHSHRENHGHIRGIRYQARPQFTSNPMYLGSISIPADDGDNHDWLQPPLTSLISTTRIMIAQRMLDQANRVLDRLENPNAPQNSNSASNDLDPQESDEFPIITGVALSPGEPGQDPVINRLQEVLRDLNPHNRSQEVLRDLTPNSEMRRRRIVGYRLRNDDYWLSRRQASTTEPSGESQTPSQEQQSPRPGNASEESSSSSNARSSSGPSKIPTPPRMAQLLGRLMETQDRLRPFLERYRELMELDPVIPGGRNTAGEDIGTVEENQRVLDGVSECLHFLSHANHAMSDIIVDASEQPPRRLRSRPMVIQHSAILQAGIPIQVEAHISVGRNDLGSSESNEENSESANRPPTSTTVTSSASQNPTNVTVTSDQEPSAPSQPWNPQQQNQQAETTLDAIFNLTNNMEVLMEMGSPDGSGISVNGVSATVGSEPAQNAGSNNNNDNNNAPGTSRVIGTFPWGPAPSPGALRSLLNVFAGYMAQRLATATTNVTTAPPATTTNSCSRDRGMAAPVGGGAAPNPGQSTQARSNVGTHPTTSTQTRSTSRPHVFHSNAPPIGLASGMGQNLFFDMLLPCNSHHIRRPSSATPNNSAATSSPQQPSQPSQVNTPNENLQTRSVGTQQNYSDGPSTTAPSTANVNTNRSSTISLQEEIDQALLDGETSSENVVTLEDLLRARGINLTCQEFHEPHTPTFQQLFSICAKIKLSEWHSFLTTGKFTCSTTNRTLRLMLSHWAFFNDAADEIRFVNELSAEIKSYIRRIWLINEQPVNVPQTQILEILDSVITSCIQRLVSNIHEKDLNDEDWASNLLNKTVPEIAYELYNQLSNVMSGNGAGFEDFIRRLTALAMKEQNKYFREWVLGGVLERFFVYLRSRGNLALNRATDIQTFNVDELFETEDSAKYLRRAVETQSAPEPMETEEASGNRTINDPLDIDDGQEIPTTFPGHEQLLPEWVPIIARDGVRQRRQLQLENSGVTAMSDAYLDGLPSKRRRLVEQQRPRLLVSPRPNHASIPASMERLVRVSVVRAGVEEADGAAAAVAADPAVRQAFGQAIRECLNPRRLQSPDFPDARRFPNATSFFADKKSPPKQ